MILVWGAADDPPTDAIVTALVRAGANYVLLDQLRPPPPARFGFGDSFYAQVGELDMADVTAVFIRPQDAATLAARGALWPGTAYLHHCLLSWTELTDALVVTRLSAQASNTAKLVQAVAISSVGFCVPESLATTDPVAARAFFERHRSVIYKSLSGVRSIVRTLPPSEFDRLDDVRSCPTLFQEHVTGTDYRVHVVSRCTFATRISSAADDYRYDARTERIAVELPAEVTDRCVALAESLDMPLAGIDLRHTPDGRWVCFEANPAPAFPYFAQASQIADATAALLAAGPTAGSRPVEPPTQVRPLSDASVEYLADGCSASVSSPARPHRTQTVWLPGP